jgi:hypothetical protein
MNAVASSPNFDTSVGADADPAIDYRSLSITAVVSVIFGVLSFSGFIFSAAIIFAVAGLIIAFLAVGSVRKYPAELTGLPVAITGVLLNGLILVAAPGYHAYVYANEVPDGYDRAQFSDLMSSSLAGELPTDIARELDGKKVFLKGYVHIASTSSQQAKNFILVPDYATCCYGKEPPLTHMIEVKMLGGDSVKVCKRKLSLTGTFSCSEGLKPRSGIKGVYYQLIADSVSGDY